MMPSKVFKSSNTLILSNYTRKKHYYNDCKKIWQPSNALVVQSSLKYKDYQREINCPEFSKSIFFRFLRKSVKEAQIQIILAAHA